MDGIYAPEYSEGIDAQQKRKEEEEEEEVKKSCLAQGWGDASSCERA
jgi:hypothetical protein